MTPIERLQVRFYKDSLKLMNQKSKTAPRFRFSEYLESHGYKKIRKVYLPMYSGHPILQIRTFWVYAYDAMTKEPLWKTPMPRNLVQADMFLLAFIFSNFHICKEKT